MPVLFSLLVAQWLLFWVVTHNRKGVFMAGIQIGGLISGMDTQSFVDQLVKARSAPVELLQVQKTDLEADVAAWSNVSALMSTLTSSLDVLRNWDTWNQMTTTPSDSTKLTATAGTTAVAAVYNVVINNLAQAHSAASDKASDLGVVDASSNLVGSVLTAGDAFTIEGVTFTVGQDEFGQTLSGTESLASIKSKINNVSAQGLFANEVTASILDNRLVINRVNTGSTNISMVENTGTPLQALGIFSAPATYKAANELVSARDASFSINGANITRSSNTNLTDVIENVTLNLKAEATVASNLTLTVGRDTAAPKAAIQDFVTSYNSVVSKLESYTKITLKGNDTPEVGQLQGDQIATSLLYNLRKLAGASKSPYMNSTNASYSYNGVTGTMDSLEDIGVWTSGKENVFSVTNETKLDSMLNNYFDEVEQLFRGVAGDSGYEHGVAQDLYNFSYGASKPITGGMAVKIMSLEERVDEDDLRINKMFDDLAVYEDKLKAQFAAMEDSIATMKQQLSWLTAQLGGSS